MTKAGRLRELLRTEAPVVSPGVFDGYSVLMAQAMGFKTAGVSGAALSHSRIVRPDVGILSLNENVDACRQLSRSVSIPLMADADAGYGNAVTVYHVVQMFEDAGIVGINIEDQVMPKRCGHMAGKELVDTAEMVMKITAAVKARRDPDFIINARTDALAVEGLDATIERLKAYADAGADLIYPDALESEEQLVRIIEAVPNVPFNFGAGFGLRPRGTMPLVPFGRLKELGVARVSMPRLLSSAALVGMRNALAAVREHMLAGDISEHPDLQFSMQEMTALMGYERVAEVEREVLTEAALTRRYGAPH